MYLVSGRVMNFSSYVSLGACKTVSSVPELLFEKWYVDFPWGWPKRLEMKQLFYERWPSTDLCLVLCWVNCLCDYTFFLKKNLFLLSYNSYKYPKTGIHDGLVKQEMFYLSRSLCFSKSIYRICLLRIKWDKLNVCKMPPFPLVLNWLKIILAAYSIHLLIRKHLTCTVCHMDALLGPT